MRAGQLRHVGTIEQATDDVDATSGPVTSYAPYLPRIRCHVLPADSGMVGGEAPQGGPQIQADIDTKVRIRYRPGITERMRFRHHVGGQGSPTLDEVYDIQAVTAGNLKRTELWLWCKRRIADGYRGGTP